MKLAVGTAQFGMAYGINNVRGRVPQDDVRVILRRARDSGIDVVDTAPGYGESEAVLGAVLADCRDAFRVVSKLPSCTSAEVNGYFSRSLERLKADSLYGYLIHSFTGYQKDRGIWGELERLRDNGRIAKIGFSLYYPHELESIFASGISFDMIQLPYSLFDRRFEKDFVRLKEQGVEIHVRSVFLQGLLFKAPADVPPPLGSARAKIDRLHRVSRESSVPIESLCLSFVTTCDLVDRVVVGVDSLGQLSADIDALRYEERVRTMGDELGSFAEYDEDIVVPARWMT